MDGPLSLAGSLVEHLSGVAWEALAIALSAHAAKATVRTRAWWNILAAAYPGDHIRWRVALAAHLAGVGVNAVAPARGSGEVVKLYLVRREIAGAKYPTLTATLAAEMVFDLTAASALLAWAAQAGALPPLGTPPIGPALAAALLAGVLCAAAFASRARARLAPLARSLVQGLMVLRRGRLYLRHVALWQATDWLLRLVTVYWFMRAFGLPADVELVLLVQLASSLAALLPVTLARVGTKQALVLAVLAGQAPTVALLGFSVGMEVAIVAANVLLGAAALGLTLRTFRWWRLRLSAAPSG